MSEAQEVLCLVCQFYNYIFTEKPVSALTNLLLKINLAGIVVRRQYKENISSKFSKMFF